MAPTGLDAALVGIVDEKRVMYLFKGCWVAAYVAVDQVWEPTGPTAVQRIAACWPDLAEDFGRAGCDAAWQGEHETIWLTRGNTLFTYDPVGQDVEKATLTGTISNLPRQFAKGVDAALNTKKRVYLFKGAEYCSYEYGKDAAGPVQELQGAGPLDAAAWVDSQKTAYLFSGAEYRTATVDDKTGTIAVASGAPLRIADTWTAAPIGTPTLDLYFFSGDQFTRARTNIEITTYDDPLPKTVTADTTALGHKLAAVPPSLLRFHVSPDNRRAYVADPPAGTLSALDISADAAKVLWTQPVGDLTMTTATPMRDQIWTTGVLEGTATITHLRIQDDKPAVTVKPVPGVEQGAVTVTADAKTLYVSRAAGVGKPDVLPVDAQTLLHKDAIASSDHRALDLAVTPDGTQLYTLTGESEPAVSRQVTMVPVANPTPSKPVLAMPGLMSLTATPDNAGVLVVQNQEKAATLDIITTSDTHTSSAPLPGGPTFATAAVDPLSRRAWLPRVSDGKVVIVDLASPQNTPVEVPLDSPVHQHPVELGVHWS